MKQLNKLSAIYKGFLTLLFLTAVELGVFAQSDSSASSSSTTTTTTVTWYSQPWVWVVGGAVLLIIIIALVRGGGTDRVTNTVIKEK